MTISSASLEPTSTTSGETNSHFSRACFPSSVIPYFLFPTPSIRPRISNQSNLRRVLFKLAQSKQYSRHSSLSISSTVLGVKARKSNTSPTKRYLSCNKLANAILDGDRINLTPSSLKVKTPERLLTRPTPFRNGAYIRHGYGTSMDSNVGVVLKSATEFVPIIRTNSTTIQNHSCFPPLSSGIDQPFLFHSALCLFISVIFIIMSTPRFW